MSRIGRGGPDRPQCADAAKRSGFDRVGIMLAASASGRRRPMVEGRPGDPAFGAGSHFVERRLARSSALDAVRLDPADMAGLAVGSTRSRLTHLGSRP